MVDRSVSQSSLFSYVFVTQWTVAHQAPLSMGFPRQEYWSELPFPTPADLPDPRIEHSSLSSCLLHWQADSLPLAPPGKPHSRQSPWRERAKGKVLCVLPPRQEDGWSHVEGWERPKEMTVHRKTQG